MLQPLEYAGSSDSGLIADKRDKSKRSPHCRNSRIGTWTHNRLRGQLAFHHSGMGSAGGHMYEMPTIRQSDEKGV